ncbi:MAG: decaprenyl-phosphate phosphoribosyltransferase [Chloroflexi bacterium]|nr:decaprenyl-phosphate phosphoribosyltransferase [Chloroflexota bacterium]
MQSAMSLWGGIPASVRGLIRTMRPKQWSKNGFVFMGILFDARLFDLDALWRVLVAFWLFSLTASSVYIMNDLVDIERDRLHPKKKNRPLPSGQLPIGLAKTAAVVFPLLSIGLGFLVNWQLAAVLASYMGLQIAYSFYLKNQVLLDVFAIAAGFVLRTIAGVVAIEVTNFSAWLYVCAGLLSLFLAIGKRRQELVLLQGDAEKVRDTYKGYNIPLLDDMLRLVVTSVALAYTLYAAESETALVDAEYMLLTVPFVYYGLFRYLYVIHRLGKGGDPTEVLFEDRPLLVGIGLWGLLVVFLLYVVAK